MMDLPPNTAGPVRATALAATAIVLSLLFRACVPLLLDQTSPARMGKPPRIACRIPLVPEQAVEERLFEPKTLPEPSAPPEPDMPIPAIDLPEIAPPEIQLAEAPSLDINAQTPVTAPLTDLALRIDTPPTKLPSLSGLAVKPGANQLAMDLKPHKLCLHAKTTAMGHRFNLDQVDQRPEGISTMQPLYPYRAKQLAIEGYVTVRFLVSQTGSVLDLSILEAKPVGVFEQAVENTVRRWRFKPARKNGQPVETWVKTSIEFRLDHAS